jgi:imidazolonepropionase-like amidohydrolase
VDQCLHAAREELRQGADFIKIMVSGGVVSPTDKLTNLQYTPEEIRAFTKVASDSGTWVTAHAYTPAAIRNAVENGVLGIGTASVPFFPDPALTCHVL